MKPRETAWRKVGEEEKWVTASIGEIENEHHKENMWEEAKCEVEEVLMRQWDSLSCFRHLFCREAPNSWNQREAELKNIQVISEDVQSQHTKQIKS